MIFWLNFYFVFLLTMPLNRIYVSFYAKKLLGKGKERLLHFFVLWLHLNLFLWFNKYWSSLLFHNPRLSLLFFHVNWHFLPYTLVPILQTPITNDISDFSLLSPIHPLKTFENLWSVPGAEGRNVRMHSLYPKNIYFK